MIDITRAQTIEGWMTDKELMWLANAATGHRNILEIGAYKGRSTMVLCDNTQGVVTAVDIEGFPEMYDIFGGHIKVSRLGLRRETSDEAFQQFRATNKKFDMIFIDGDHSYEAVCKDIANAQWILSEGGLLCGHDFSDACGVKRAVMKLVPAYKLVDDTCIWYREG